jgi:hypothetical protein
MNLVKQGTWVQIKKIILKPSQRAHNLPEQTKKTPLMMWVKGFLTENALIGEEVTIKTLTGRIEQGELLKINPSFMHTYGEFIPEILMIDKICKDTLFGCESNE